MREGLSELCPKQNDIPKFQITFRYLQSNFFGNLMKFESSLLQKPLPGKWSALPLPIFVVPSPHNPEDAGSLAASPAALASTSVAV